MFFSDKQRRLSCRKSRGKWLARTNPQFLTSELQISLGSLAWTIYTGQRSAHTSVHHDSLRRSLEHWFCCGNQGSPASPLERRRSEIEAGSSDRNPAACVTSMESKGSRSEGNRGLSFVSASRPSVRPLSSLNFSFSLRSFPLASHSGDYPAMNGLGALRLTLTGIFYFATAIIAQPFPLLSRITLRRCTRCISNNDIQVMLSQWIIDALMTDNSHIDAHIDGRSDLAM